MPAPTSIPATLPCGREDELLAILARLFDASFRLGHLTFREAGRFVLLSVRASLGDSVAAAIRLSQMQGAYIGMAGRYRDSGADNPTQVAAVKSVRELISVAWSPENSLGAVMAPPGEMTPLTHKVLLWERVQGLLDQDEDPKWSLRLAEEMLTKRGILDSLPDRKRVGMEIVEASEHILRERGILIVRPVHVPNRDNPEAKASMEEVTLVEWVAWVTAPPPGMFETDSIP